MTNLRSCSAATLGLPGQRTYLLDGHVPPAPRLAVIGSRAARVDRLELLTTVVAAASSCGLAIVSGGAVGVDAAAHRAALAAGVPQLAVLPCSPERPYPPHHAPLFREIAAAQGSGLLYGVPPGTPPARAVFASRNAAVVGLAGAVLVIEAHGRSGSLGTGRLALARGVPVAAVLGATGCAELVGRGARALPVDPSAFAAGLAAWLAGLGGGPTAPPPDWPARLAWLDEALARAGPNGLSLDVLERPLERLGDLLAAEREGLIVEAPPGRYRRVGSRAARDGP